SPSLSVAPHLAAATRFPYTTLFRSISARIMLETGDWLVPRDQKGAEVGRPVGILWLQALSAKLFGPETHDAIWAYRLPSLLGARSEEHTSELQSRENLVCRLLLEKK